MQSETFLIYNVTSKVSHKIQHDWLQWMKEYHIPAIIATGCFFKATILQLQDAEDEEGVTYAIQYHTSSQTAYETYLQLHASRLRQETFDKWGSQFIAFRTVMHVVN